MIKKVSNLKKFGIFRDFSWSSDTPDFTRFNLIYGWNKSGKTTFSRIFSACEKKTTEFKQYPKDGEFEIRTNSGITIRHSDCQSETKQFRVFNKDFIEDNISFDPSNPSRPIVYVSEEDIESNKKLKELKERGTSLAQKFEAAKKDREKSERAEDNFRKSTARTIKDIIGNLKVYDKYRDYDKGSIKTAIENIGIENLTALSDNDFEKKKKLTDGDSPKSQSLFSKFELKFLFNGKNLSNFSDIYNELSALLKRQVMGETVERFKNDLELNKWAQHGFELHKTKNEKEKCLFCQNEFSVNFLGSLSRHFSGDYEKLQQEIVSFVKGLTDLKKEKIAEENSGIYADLQESYNDFIKKLNSVVGELNDWIDEATKRLNEKHDNPLLIVALPKSPKDFKKSYDDVIDELNTIIINHNLKVENHVQEVATAKEALERHLIAIAIKEQDYSKIKTDYDSSIEAEKEAKNAVEENNLQISKLEKETSNIGKAIQKMAHPGSSWVYTR